MLQVLPKKAPGTKSAQESPAGSGEIPTGSRGFWGSFRMKGSLTTGG